ncbi:hypothetical protein [Bacillus sp. 166amftsu]|nr:hypothetical protein [Bacillus sp. 166amftsu]SDZ39102.1 hypothetical protein SAMN04488156_12432 [Bacillus sp. 166amftsu]
MKKRLFAMICLLSISAVFFSIADNKPVNSNERTYYMVSDPGGH